MDSHLDGGIVPDRLPAELTDAATARPSTLLESLVSALNGEHVGYCYWKSSARTGAALMGNTDLDLLVGRLDQHRAARILFACGFKLFPVVAFRDHPSAASYVGYDVPSGRLVHVHLHLRLISGEALLRNYRLRLEETVLAAAIQHPQLQIRMLDPASEAVVLAVRSCLETTPMDPVALLHRRALRRKFDRDRLRLGRETDRLSVRSRAAALLSAPTADLLTAFVFEQQAGSGLRRRLRRRLQRELAGDRMYNAVEARLRSLWRAAYWLAGAVNARHLHVPRPWARRAPGGGCVVALLGVDGSGKTTVGAAVRAWLSAEVDVMPIYFGTGDGRPSLILWPLKMILPLAGRLVRRKPRGSSHGTVSDAPPGFVYSMLLIVWATVLAVEKRAKFRAAHRGAARGLVVVCDRYAQDELPDYNDGPLLPRLPRVPAFLRRFEARAYAMGRKLRPDLVIKLQASPELLAIREPTMDGTVIRQRVDALSRLSFAGSRVVCVDAAAPLPDVLRAVKGEIWAML